MRTTKVILTGAAFISLGFLAACEPAGPETTPPPAPAPAETTPQTPPETPTTPPETTPPPPAGGN